jgi:ElaB/YqjD/DUF883 family membrane-anchored ribosome-binding protein
MASEPIPEPLTNQELNSEREAGFPSSGPELVHRAAPPIPPDRELPRAPRQEEWKEAVKQKMDDVKQTASRAAETASRAMQDAGQQAAAGAAQARDRAADIYRDSREQTLRAWRRTRVRANEVINEYPLHVIAGVAGAAFLVGVLLRVWRSNRDA